ncbi:hypothetical protein PR048_009151 [Dryococelus australis]|uniref:Uncharacterized protein n=1 Tax=Dryococelus australis TaxID=614101 RepID=A0ABQ9HZ50_9NEOP|nr:hypothetical protein PR048_009151 [Dryococelus australis]
MYGAATADSKAGRKKKQARNGPRRGIRYIVRRWSAGERRRNNKGRSIEIGSWSLEDPNGRRRRVTRGEYGAAPEGSGGGSWRSPRKPASSGTISTCENLNGVPAGNRTQLLALHQGEPGSIPGRLTADYRRLESCRTMPLVGGFLGDLPFSPLLYSGACPCSPHFTPLNSHRLSRHLNAAPPCGTQGLVWPGGEVSTLWAATQLCLCSCHHVLLALPSPYSAEQFPARQGAREKRPWPRDGSPSALRFRHTSRALLSPFQLLNATRHPLRYVTPPSGTILATWSVRQRKAPTLRNSRENEQAVGVTRTSSILQRQRSREQTSRGWHVQSHTTWLLRTRRRLRNIERQVHDQANFSQLSETTLRHRPACYKHTVSRKDKRSSFALFPFSHNYHKHSSYHSKDGVNPKHITRGKAVCLQPATEMRCCPGRSAILHHDRRFHHDDQPMATTIKKMWSVAGVTPDRKLAGRQASRGAVFMKELTTSTYVFHKH